MTDRRQRTEPVPVERRQSTEKFSCHACQSRQSVVVKPTWHDDHMRRIRECRACGARYETEEKFTRVLQKRRGAA